MCFISNCSNAQDMSSKKILIVYLSRTNNTKAIAEIIQRNVHRKGSLIEPFLFFAYSRWCEVLEFRTPFTT